MRFRFASQFLPCRVYLRSAARATLPRLGWRRAFFSRNNGSRVRGPGSTERQPAHGAIATRFVGGKFSLLGAAVAGAVRLVPTAPFACALAVLLLTAAALLGGIHCSALQEFARAEKSFNDDRPDEAAAHLSFCMTVWPWSADTHFLAARICRTSDRCAEAEGQLNECRRLEGPAARTQLEMLLLRAQRGEVEQVGDGLLYAVDHGEADERLVLEALARGYMSSVATPRSDFSGTLPGPLSR